jgi:holliday junction DNA helicase RuvA
MIASLHGQIKAVRSDSIIVDIGGVGYQVHVPGPLLSELAHVGQTVDLYTHTHVRENELALYGFRSLEELDLFTLLIGVSGIGPRTGLAILSTFAPETLRDAIARGDALALTRIPGIGRKTAQRLVLDLKDKIGAPSDLAVVTSLNAADADVINALTALGYSVAEAQSALATIPQDVQELDERILATLRSLGSR